MRIGKCTHRVVEVPCFDASRRLAKSLVQRAQLAEMLQALDGQVRNRNRVREAEDELVAADREQLARVDQVSAKANRVELALVGVDAQHRVPERLVHLGPEVLADELVAQEVLGPQEARPEHVALELNPTATGSHPWVLRRHVPGLGRSAAVGGDGRLEEGEAQGALLGAVAEGECGAYESRGGRRSVRGDAVSHGLVDALCRVPQVALGYERRRGNLPGSRLGLHRFCDKCAESARVFLRGAAAPPHRGVGGIGIGRAGRTAGATGFCRDGELDIARLAFVRSDLRDRTRDSRLSACASGCSVKS